MPTMPSRAVVNHGDCQIMSCYRSSIYRPLLATAVLMAAFVLPSSAQAQQTQKTQAGTLTCKQAPSIGLIIGSQQRMACRFTRGGSQPVESYLGVMNRIGLDIGFSAGGILGWAVYAPTSGAPRGALAGT